MDKMVRENMDGLRNALGIDELIAMKRKKMIAIIIKTVLSIAFTVVELFSMSGIFEFISTPICMYAALTLLIWAWSRARSILGLAVNTLVTIFFIGFILGSLPQMLFYTVMIVAGIVAIVLDIKKYKELEADTRGY